MGSFGSAFTNVPPPPPGAAFSGFGGAPPPPPPTGVISFGAIQQQQQQAPLPPPPAQPTFIFGSAASPAFAERLQMRRCFDSNNSSGDDMSEEEDEWDETPQKPPSNQPLANNHQTVTNAQDPAGFWSELASFDLDHELLVKIQAIYSDVQVAGTIYALILLLARFSDAYDEWKLSAMKGCGFLKKKLGEDAVEKLKAIDGPEIDEELVDELFE